MFLGQSIWMWFAFLAIIITLLALDLGLFHKKAHVIKVKESLKMTAFFVTISLCFSAWVYYLLGAQAASEYLTGYLIEFSLSMDNIFVISLIFSYFAIPQQLQHRVLFWGILCVIIFRAVMILIGAKLVAEFHWILYIFAAFLLITGIKMLFTGNTPKDIGNNPLLKFLKRHLRVTHELHGEHFFIKGPSRKNSSKMVWWCTPLFIALILIEVADIIFAVDSIPAIFAITDEPYVIYTSNIFAVLGLRALYFSLAAIIHRFEYLKYSLAVILVFIGGKVFVTDWLGLVKFPASLSLSITIFILMSGVGYSLYRTREHQKG